MFAARQEEIKAVGLLIEVGADIELEDKNGHTGYGVAY